MPGTPAVASALTRRSLRRRRPDRPARLVGGQFRRHHRGDRQFHGCVANLSLGLQTQAGQMGAANFGI